MTIYYHVYFQQYGKYLEVDIIGSKATNKKQEKIFLYLSYRSQGLNSGPFSMSLLPCHLSHCTASCLNLFCLTALPCILGIVKISTFLFLPSQWLFLCTFSDFVWVVYRYYKSTELQQFKYSDGPPQYCISEPTTDVIWLEESELKSWRIKFNRWAIHVTVEVVKDRTL